ncbi:MAG: EAL domain-containing protein [Aeromicrobium sp.]
MTVLISSLAWISSQRSNDSIRDAAQSRLRSNQGAAVRALVRETDDYKRAAATLATDKPIINRLRSDDKASDNAAEGELSTIARSMGSPAAFVSNLLGRNVVIYPKQNELIGKDFSFRDWFKGSSRTGKPYVSEGYRSAATGHPFVVAVAAPVLDGTRRIGYVVILWQLDSVRAVSDGARKDGGVGITVTDQRGQSLLASLKVDGRGEPVVPRISDATRKALAGERVSSSAKGMLQESGPVPDLGWTVTATLPMSTALLPSKAFQHRQEINLGVAFLILALFTGFSIMVLRKRAVEHERAEGERRRLYSSEERFRRVFDGGLTGKFLANAGGDVVQINATMADLLGGEPGRFTGLPLVGFFDNEEDRQSILRLIRRGKGDLRTEMALHDSQGRILWAQVAMTWISEHAGPDILLVQVEDVTARRAAEQQLSVLALHDELTELPNRRLFLERCEVAFALAKSGRSASTSVAILFIDLDGFKKVNDGAGHETGDRLLRVIAEDLQNILRPGDTVARIGGDEFVVLIEQESGLDYLRSVADRIITTIRRQVSTEDGITFAVSASVGIARIDLADEPDVGPDQLLRRADAAMYRAKEGGRDRHDVFDSILRDSTEARQFLEQAMRIGLRDNGISLVYQPVIDVDSNTVIGAEALMRLTDSTGRLLPTLPAVIAAENAGLAEAFGDRVLDLALGTARDWPERMSIAVNISARELTGRVMRERIESALQRHSFDPSRLILEITETSILIAGRSAMAELEKLRQQGVRVAIDDFGTAYATLQNLTKLPVDILKVDASFTAGLPDQLTHSAVVHGIASIAFELGIPCIVEGVETAAQLDAIQGMAVQAQGWFWGKPRGPEYLPGIYSAHI